MDTNVGESCALCFSLVPRPLMPFHRIWHEQQDRAALERLLEPAAGAETTRVRHLAPVRETSVPRMPQDRLAELRRELVAEMDGTVERPAPRGSTTAERRRHRLRRLVLAGGAVAASAALVSVTELTLHLRDVDGRPGDDGHRVTILPHPHPH